MNPGWGALGERVVLGTPVPAHRVTTTSGRDVTGFVRGTGGYYWGSPGDTLLVDMTPPRTSGTFGAQSTEDDPGAGGTLEGALKVMEVVFDDLLRARPAPPLSGTDVDASILSSTGIVVEAPDGGEGWRTLTRYYPRQHRDEAAFDSLGSGRYRLIFFGRHRLYFIGRIQSAGATATQQYQTLLAARHSRLGDAKSTVTQPGGSVDMMYGVQRNQTANCPTPPCLLVGTLTPGISTYTLEGANASWQVIAYNIDAVTFTYLDQNNNPLAATPLDGIDAGGINPSVANYDASQRQAVRRVVVNLTAKDNRGAMPGQGKEPQYVLWTNINIRNLEGDERP